MDDNLEKHINAVNECVGGVFLYGFITGIIMSYSGFLSYLAGLGTGVFISTKYKYISVQITEKTIYLFQNVLNKAKNNK